MEPFLTSGGGLCVPRARLREFFGMSERELRALFTARKKLFRTEKVARGYELASVDGVPCMLLPKRVAVMLARCPNAAALHGGAEPLMPAGMPVPRGTIPLFAYQEACVEALLGAGGDLSAKRAAAGTAMCYLNLPAGGGKTLVGVEVGRRCGGKIAVVVPRLQIGEQWRTTAEEHIPGVTVVQVSAVPQAKRARAIAGAGVVVMTPGMALVLQETPHFWNQFAVVLLDEAHMMAADTWRDVLSRLTAGRTLGLSATTDERVDGMDPVAKWHLGPPLMARDEIEGFAEMEVTFRGRLRVVSVQDAELAAAMEGLSHAAAQQLLHAHAPWVTLVVGEVATLLTAHEHEDLHEGQCPERGRRPRHNVIVFCEPREAVQVYAEAIGEWLASEGAGTVAAPEVGYMMGGTAPAAVTAAIQGARVLVTTYAYSAVGISLNRFTAALMATTRKSQVYQIMARILRVKSDTAVRRDYVCLVGPRSNWQKHARAMKACARALEFAVVEE